MTDLAGGTTAPAMRRGVAGFAPSDAAVIVGAFLGTRLLLTAFGLVMLTIGPDKFYPAALPDLYVRWDSEWYLSLAQGGYSPADLHPTQPGATNYAFYPLYPLLMWIVAHATGLSLAWAGVLISNLCFLGALFIVFALAEEWSGDRAVARVAVLLLCCVPEGFVFSAVYTESLFLLLTGASMLLFERRQYLAAGMCAALSSAVRSNGVLVVVYFGLSLLREGGFKRTLRFWDEPERYLPIVMAPLGLFGFWWMAMLTTGDAFAQASTAAHGWDWRSTWPWTNIVQRLTSTNLREFWPMAASLVVFAGSLTLLRRSNWPLFAYCLVNFLLFWTGTSPNSLLRYSIVLLPIYFGVARLIAPRPVVAMLLLGGCFAVETVMMLLWAHGSVLVV